jgi:hypothetical protein
METIGLVLFLIWHESVLDKYKIIIILPLSFLKAIKQSMMKNLKFWKTKNGENLKI